MYNLPFGKKVSQETRDKIAIKLSGCNNYIEIKMKIIELFNTGKYSRKELSNMFKLSYQTVKGILRKNKKEVLDGK